MKIPTSFRQEAAPMPSARIESSASCGVPNELGCPGTTGTPANENERRRGGVRGVSYPQREKAADSGNGAQLGP